MGKAPGAVGGGWDRVAGGTWIVGVVVEGKASAQPEAST